MQPSEPEIRSILTLKSVAVAGCSPRPQAASHGVALYLMRAGYRVTPVRPGYSEMLGRKCYPNLTSLPEPAELVVVFRRPEEVWPVVREAIQTGAKAVWMQEGITHAAAASEAQKAGLKVVMDSCIRREIEKRLHFRGAQTTC